MLMYVQIRLAVCKIHLALPRQALCFLHLCHSKATNGGEGGEGGGTWGEKQAKVHFVVVPFVLIHILKVVK